MTWPPSVSCDLVILGAGVSGLAAAWKAAQRGLSVVVLDKDQTVGGAAASFDVGGVMVDQGSHRLHPATPDRILTDVQELLGDDLQLRRRNGRLRIAGTWVGFPLQAGELARALPGHLLAAAARDAALAPTRRSHHTSYADALRAGLGPALYDAMWAPYAQKLWGLPGDQLSAEQARVRVSADTPWKVVARLLRGRRTGSGQGRTFYYPRRGFGQLPTALADAATAAGAQIRLRQEVERIDLHGDAVTVSMATGESIDAWHTFSTLPLPLLARITRPAPALADIEAAHRLRYRAVVLVYLVHEGGRWSPYDAHYLPGSETPVTRISEPANYRDSVDDPSDRTVLCAEIACWKGDRIWNATEYALADLVEETLRAEELPAIRRADVVVRRMPNVYPVYQLGYENNLTGLDKWATSLPRVTTFGRLGLFAHDNTHHAMDMAYEAVDALRPDRRFDTLAWAAARERFAEHVVED
jgi:protoporphyrinogen oxidase